MSYSREVAECQGSKQWRCLDQNGLHMYAPTEYWMESFSYLGNVVKQSAKVAVIEVKRKKLGIVRNSRSKYSGAGTLERYKTILSFCHVILYDAETQPVVTEHDIMQKAKDVSN